MDEDRVLYEGDPINENGTNIICIDIREGCTEDHDLWLGPRSEGIYVPLGRSILDDLSRSSLNRVRQTLENISSGEANKHIEGGRYGSRHDNTLMYAPVALACARARLREEELTVNSLLDGTQRLPE